MKKYLISLKLSLLLEMNFIEKNLNLPKIKLM